MTLADQPPSPLPQQTPDSFSDSSGGGSPEAVPNEHVHEWVGSPGIVIDTMPPQHPYGCTGCDAFTHDPSTGEPCQTCDPRDYRLRTTNLITLTGGPLDGTVMAKPSNRNIYLRVDSLDKDVQKAVKYEATDDPKVWVFRWSIWTFPVVPREPLPASSPSEAQGDQKQERATEEGIGE